MSTAGKVLVVLIMLSAIGCMILGAGVAQVNYLGNARLDKLDKDVAKAQEDIETTRLEIIKVRDQTILTQEKIDRDVTALRAQQNDLERTKTQVFETLERLKLELASVNQTIEGARTSLQHRIEEFDAEEKAMDDLRRQVQGLKSNNSQQMERLQTLRTQFQDTYHKSQQMLGKPRATR